MDDVLLAEEGEDLDDLSCKVAREVEGEDSCIPVGE